MPGLRPVIVMEAKLLRATPLSVVSVGWQGATLKMAALTGSVEVTVHV